MRMRKFTDYPALFLLLVILLLGCQQKESRFYAADYGVLPANSGEDNSKNLQALIDRVSTEGGIIYLPAGVYEFAENGQQTIGSHCIHMRSNVTILGDGDETVLKPVGNSQYGLDMFYYNAYLDTGKADYLENCTFQNFVIDGSETSCETYTSAGKGFMFNLFRNCHWLGVTVKNTDATGFGVDCPIDSSMKNCIAIGCGKAATENSTGASGFGIGFGYSNAESITISGCTATDNAKFGFFFEHQGRFDHQRYQANTSGEFLVTNCHASKNLYNFGGIVARNVLYDGCKSRDAIAVGFYFEDCRNCSRVNCESWNDPEEEVST